MAEEITERVFAVSAPARLSLSNLRGSVSIRSAGPGAEGESISVRAVKWTDSGSAAYTQIEMRQELDGRVVVETRFEAQASLLFLFGLRRPCRVDYVVTVPAHCSAAVSCISANLEMEGVQGDLSLKTVSGSMDLRRLAGAMDVRIVSGSLRAEGLSGRLRLDCTSGRVSLLQCNLEAVEASNVSGSVEVETPLAAGPYRLTTVSGPVTLRLPRGAGCSLEMTRLSGSFSTALPAARRYFGQTHEQADINGGGPLVIVHTTSGSCSVLESDHLPPAPPALVEAERQVLERIARGELTAEEGLQAIKSSHP